MRAEYPQDLSIQLQEALAEIENLETVVIPAMNRDHDDALNRERAIFSAALNEVHLEKEKLEAELKNLSLKLKEANDEIVRLKNIINRDSKTTSLPHSVDWTKRHKEDIPEETPTKEEVPDNKETQKEDERKAANEYNSRKPSERKKGGQPGRKGNTLTIYELKKMMEDYPDSYKIEVFDIGKITDNETSNPRVKYELDLDFKVIVREYRYYGDTPIPPKHYSDVTYGDFTKATASFCYGQCNMPTDKICELFEALSGGMIAPSEGSCYNFCAHVADGSTESLAYLEKELLEGKVIYSDATVTTENGKESYVRNVSNPQTVIYYPQDKKTIEEIGKNPVLAQYDGILMTDHETAMKHFGAKHAECNQHIARYCEKTTVEARHKWSKGFMSNLYDIKKDKEERMRKGEEAFPADILEAYSQKYDEWLSLGWKENPSTIWKSVAQDERALLNRLKTYKEDHLRFATDWEVEFTNNISESDLRFIKGRTKLSGGFRQKSGREMCCKIMSIIRTCKKRGLNIIEKLVSISKNGENVFA